MRHDGGLDPGTFAERLNSRTRVAALTLAGNGLGTLVSVPELVREVRRCSPDALVVLDAVHAAPHVPLDVAALGVDVLAFSTYKLFGPMAGVLWVSEDAGKRLSWYHVAPHTAQQSRAELGTLNTSTVAGTLAGLEYLRGIGERLEPHAVGLCAGLPRERRKLRLAMEAIRGYEQALSLRLLGGMTDLPGLKLHGVTDPARVADRVPTVAFTLQGVPATEYERLLWEVGGIQIGSGSHYSGAVLRGLGVEGVGRASFAHYNSRGDTEALIQALDAARRVGQNRR
jgi:selenocysteine lyase/cysteine desulfurase